MHLTQADQQLLGLTPDDMMREEAPLAVITAIHEAGHAVARMVTGIHGSDLIVREDGSGISEPGTHRAINTSDSVVVSLAGPLAEGELLVRFNEESLTRDGAYMWGSADGDMANLSNVPEWLVDRNAEARTVALIWHNWSAVVRVASAALMSPTRRLTWDEQVIAAGPVADAPDDVFGQAYDDLESYDVISFVTVLRQLTESAPTG